MSKREEFIPKLTEIFVDESKDLRLIELLAEHIGDIALNFPPEVSKKSFYPMYKQLINEKIASLRNSAAKQYFCFLELFKGQEEFKNLVEETETYFYRS